MQRNILFGGPLFCRNEESVGASLLELFKGEPFHKKRSSLLFLAGGLAGWGGPKHSWGGFFGVTKTL